MTASKNIFFYSLLSVALVLAIREGYRVNEYRKYLKVEYPDCTPANPNFFSLFFGTMAV